MEEPAMERELLDALRDIEDQFIRAYDVGEEVSGMLEASNVHLNSGIDELKENSINSSKLLYGIDHRHLYPLRRTRLVENLVLKTVHAVKARVTFLTALVDIYSKCGSIDDACLTFVKCKEKDVILWNAIVLGLAVHRNGRDAFVVFRSMERTILNDATFIRVQKTRSALTQ